MSFQIKGVGIPLNENEKVYWFVGFLVSWFLSFLVSWFRGCVVSSFRRFLVSSFLRFRDSKIKNAKIQATFNVFGRY